jgi:hypothetical protein
MASAVHPIVDERKVWESVATGSVTELVAGVGALGLAILGLAGVLPNLLAAIATIAVGAGLLFAGFGVAARYADVSVEIGDQPAQNTELTGGMIAEFVAGAAGIVLGILALLGTVPLILLSSAAIVFGAGLLLSAGVTSRLNGLTLEHAAPTERGRRLSREAVTAAAGLQALVGIGAVVLGILAVVGMVPLTLVLVALVSLGAAMLLGGTAIWGRSLNALRR